MKEKENNVNLNNTSFNNANISINSNKNKQSVVNKSKKIKYKKIINEINNSEASEVLKNELILIIKEFKKEKELNNNTSILYNKLVNLVGSYASIFSFMSPYIPLFEGVNK